MIAFFIVSFFFMFVAFITGIVGCWKTSPSNITSSAVLMLLACEFHFFVLFERLQISCFVALKWERKRTQSTKSRFFSLTSYCRQ